MHYEFNQSGRLSSSVAHWSFSRSTKKGQLFSKYVYNSHQISSHNTVKPRNTNNLFAWSAFNKIINTAWYALNVILCLTFVLLVMVNAKSHRLVAVNKGMGFCMYTQTYHGNYKWYGQLELQPHLTLRAFPHLSQYTLMCFKQYLAASASLFSACKASVSDLFSRSKAVFSCCSSSICFKYKQGCLKG